MNTSCTQPIHSSADRYLLALGTVSNNVGGSSPVSLYAFDAISGHSTRGGICALNLKSYQWNLFLSIPNFHGFLDWTFSNDQQAMYFISKQNVTVIDLSNKSSFHYRILPLIEQSGNINVIDKTVVFSAE